jgi:hypothetical protein
MVVHGALRMLEMVEALAMVSPNDGGGATGSDVS